MRVIVKYRPWGTRDWGFLTTVLEMKKPNAIGKVDFLIDTGAGQTILSEKDAIRIGLPYKNFPKGSASGVGGTATTRIIKRKFNLYVQACGGEIVTISKHGIEVLEEPSKQKTLPSLLGLEFLEQLGLKLTYDIPTRAIFLER